MSKSVRNSALEEMIRKVIGYYEVIPLRDAAELAAERLSDDPKEIAALADEAEKIIRREAGKNKRSHILINPLEKFRSDTLPACDTVVAASASREEMGGYVRRIIEEQRGISYHKPDRFLSFANKDDCRELLDSAESTALFDEMSFMMMRYEQDMFINIFGCFVIVANYGGNLLECLDKLDDCGLCFDEIPRANAERIIRKFVDYMNASRTVSNRRNLPAEVGRPYECTDEVLDLVLCGNGSGSSAKSVAAKAPPPADLPDLFIMKLKLKGTESVRVIAVESQISVARFCEIAIKTFGFENDHLICITAGSRFSLNRNPFGALEESFSDVRHSRGKCLHLDEDMWERRLFELFAAVGDKGVLEYDFSDGWRIAVSRMAEKSNVIHPCCVRTAGSDAMEECGGVHGLLELTEGAQACVDCGGKGYEVAEHENLKWAYNFATKEWNIERLRKFLAGPSVADVNSRIYNYLVK